MASGTSQGEAAQLQAKIAERRRELNECIDQIQKLDKNEQQEDRLRFLYSLRDKKDPELLQASDEEWKKLLTIDVESANAGVDGEDQPMNDDESEATSEDEDSNPGQNLLDKLARHRGHNNKQGQSDGVENKGVQDDQRESDGVEDKGAQNDQRESDRVEDKGAQNDQRESDRVEDKGAQNDQRRTSQGPTRYSLLDPDAIEGSGQEFRQGCETKALVGKSLYINAYGPKTYQIHRIEYGRDPFCDRSQLPQVQDSFQQLSKHKINNKDHMYEKDHVICFFAVAFEDKDGLGIEALNPARIEAEKERRRKAKKSHSDDKDEKRRLVYVSVGWGTPGARTATHRSWETPSNLRRIYGHRTDERIYTAARNANIRHNSYKPGQAVSSRDTTPNLLADMMRSISPQSNIEGQAVSSRDNTPNLLADMVRSISPQSNINAQMHPATQQRAVSVESNMSEFLNKDSTEIPRPSVEQDDLGNQPQNRQLTHSQSMQYPIDNTIQSLFMLMMQKIDGMILQQQEFAIKQQEFDRQLRSIQAQ
ncbi:hypothetical protein ACKLNR_014495 [Fusarium oxysporum f. sp. zingiberi]